MRVNCVLAMLALGVFAGCVGTGAGGSEASTGASATFDASGQLNADSESGSIRGLVLSDELVPVASASVQVRGSSIAAQTDVSGAYAFLNVAPGTYTVDAARLGYEAKAAKTLVEAGRTTWLNFTLAPLAVNDAYHVTSQHSAQLQCMLVTAAWVSSCSWPYTAVYLTAKGMGVNLSQYGAPPDIMDNKWRYNYSVEYGIQNIVSELAWQPGSDLAKEMWLHQCYPSYDPVQDYCDVKDYANVHGTGPLNLVWELPKPNVPKGPGAKSWIMSAVWPWPASTASVGVYLDQKISMYNTAFYGAPSPDEFSVIPK